MSAKIKEALQFIALCLAGYLVTWGVYNAITCDIDYRPLPAILLGLFIYAIVKEGSNELQGTRARR